MSKTTKGKPGLLAKLSSAAISLLIGFQAMEARAQENPPDTSNSRLDDSITARLKTFLGETEARPEYGWFNREDLIYHDQSYPPEVETHPDFWVFGRKRIWVFNRAMEWRRGEQDGTILCYNHTGELMLTGDKQVSSWHSAPPNTIEQSGEFTLFAKHSERQRDSAVMPAFQFPLGQNPTLELEVAEANGEWQFLVSIKGRGGAPMLASPWQRGAGKVSFNLEKELGGRGFDWQYPELHFALALWTPKPADNARVKFRLRMPGRAAVVAGLPVIRTASRVGKEGVPLLAAAVNASGQLLDASKVRLFATVGKQKIELKENGEIWRTVLKNLPAGNHEVILTSDGELKATAKSVVRVTDGRFFKYDKASRWVTKDGKPIGPLSGSYQGTFFFRDAGLPSERMIQGQKEWDTWDRSKAPGEHMHYWEALKPAELDERFRYLAQQGYDLLTLHSHWGLWERLDAGGRISPHAAEQLALYLRTAGKYDLAHLQALSSGPYGVPDKESGYGDTVPYSRYLEEGFQAENWFKPGSRFDELFHQYLSDFTSLFRDETAMFGLTASGEGDFTAPDRARDVFQQVRVQDTNHIMLAESILRLDKLPEKICAPYTQDMLGGRTYSIATKEILPEFDLGFEFKLYRTVSNAYMAEGSWPPMPSYTRFHYEVRKDDWGSRISWTGTPMYRIRLRDTLYLGLVHRLAIMNTWDEQMAEDEHVLVRKIREQVDWKQPFREPEVGVLVDDAGANTGNPARQNAAKYEEAFSRIPLAYRLYSTPEPQPEALVMIDGRQAFSEPKFQSKGGKLPDDLKRRLPLVISDNYCASYTWSEDRRTLLAYLYNTASHTQEYQWLGGKHHRSPQPVDFRVRFQNLAASSLRYRLYDLNDKKICREVVSPQSPDWSLGSTDHDYFLLVTPNGVPSPVQGAAVAPERNPTVYYFDSEQGDDQRLVCDRDHPFRSLDKANSLDLGPGDRLLFRRGCCWRGQLHPRGSGSASASITIDCYGNDGDFPPLIEAAGAESAVLLSNQEYWILSNISVSNLTPDRSTTRHGVLIRGADCGELREIRLENLRVYEIQGDEKSCGIQTEIGGEAAPTWFNHLVITNCRVGRVPHTGISLRSDWSTLPGGQKLGKGRLFAGSKQVVVMNNVVDYAGWSGILVRGADSPLISHNVVAGSNWNLAANGYGVGLWAVGCIDAILEYNEVYDTRDPYGGTDNGSDGNAFNISRNLRCAYRHNFSHDNHGGFMLIDNYCTPSVYKDNIVKDNLSRDDELELFQIGGVGTTRIINNIFHTGKRLQYKPYLFFCDPAGTPTDYGNIAEPSFDILCFGNVFSAEPGATKGYVVNPGRMDFERQPTPGVWPPPQTTVAERSVTGLEGGLDFGNQAWRTGFNDAATTKFLYLNSSDRSRAASIDFSLHSARMHSVDLAGTGTVLFSSSNPGNSPVKCDLDSSHDRYRTFETKWRFPAGVVTVTVENPDGVAHTRLDNIVYYADQAYTFAHNYFVHLSEPSAPQHPEYIVNINNASLPGPTGLPPDKASLLAGLIDNKFLAVDFAAKDYPADDWIQRSYGKGAEVVARVDSEPIFAVEVDAAMDELRPSILASTPTAALGEAERARLRAEALKLCFTHKMQQIIAKERGLVAETRVFALLRAMHEQNSRRQQARELFFGPEILDPEAYVAYYRRNLAIQLKRAIEDDLKPSEQEIRDYFEQQFVKQDNPRMSGASLEGARAGVVKALIDLKYDRFVEERLERATIQATASRPAPHALKSACL